jgi:hypothetical protein
MCVVCQRRLKDCRVLNPCTSDEHYPVRNLLRKVLRALCLNEYCSTLQCRDVYALRTNRKNWPYIRLQEKYRIFALQLLVCFKDIWPSSHSTCSKQYLKWVFLSCPVNVHFSVQQRPFIIANNCNYMYLISGTECQYQLAAYWIAADKRRQRCLYDWLTVHRSITLVSFQIDEQNSSFIYIWYIY